MSTQFDTIQKAKHYNVHPSGVECKDIARYLGFNLGNACKYLWRMHEKHEDPLPDLKKALFYVNDHIESMKGGDGYQLTPLPPRQSPARERYEYDTREVIAKEPNSAALAFWCLVLPDPTSLRNAETMRTVLIGQVEAAEQQGRLRGSIAVTKESFR